jgi:uncharacterized membrane protein
MIRVTEVVKINRPSKIVFDFIANFENNPRWQSGMVEAHFTSEGSLKIGSTYSQLAKFLGRSVESTFEVVELDPGKMVKASSTSGSFPITFTRIVRPIEDGSEVTAIVEGDASGFYKLAEPLLTRMVAGSIHGDYQRLKKLMESGT